MAEDDILIGRGWSFPLGVDVGRGSLRILAGENPRDDLAVLAAPTAVLLRGTRI